MCAQNWRKAAAAAACALIDVVHDVVGDAGDHALGVTAIKASWGDGGYDIGGHAGDLKV
jgi:hypothetical protein